MFSAEPVGVQYLEVEGRTNRRTALVALRGEVVRQNEFARDNRHNLAVIRGTAPIQRLLELTGVEEQLVLVDDPDDLAPPVWTR